MSVLTIGESMLDRYYCAESIRLGAETTYPIVSVKQPIDCLGGAANIAANIAALDINSHLLTVIASGFKSGQLSNLMTANNIDMRYAYLPNMYVLPVKNRIYDLNKQQIFRFDEEDYINKKINYDLLITDIKQALQEILEEHKPKCIIISDYGKQLFNAPYAILHKEIGKILTAQAKDIPIIIDGRLLRLRYELQSIFLLKMNAVEAEKITSHTKPENAIESLLGRYSQSIKNVLITAGKNGMYLGQNINNKTEVTHIPAYKPKNFYNPVGLGDVITATIAANISNNPQANLLDICNQAAIAASTCLDQPFTALIEKYKYEQELQFAGIKERNKVITTNELSVILSYNKAKNKKIVFTNGCFDNFHSGHLHLLTKCKAEGDIVIVGVNSDESVKRLKGNGRPFTNLEHRLRMLSAITYVDYVVVFAEDTPLTLIEFIKPNVLVKGNEHKYVLGQEFVAAYGGKVLTVDMLPSHSTTLLAENYLKCLSESI